MSSDSAEQFSNISEQIGVVLWNVIIIALKCGYPSSELMVRLGERGYFSILTLVFSIAHSLTGIKGPP